MVFYYIFYPFTQGYFKIVFYDKYPHNKHFSVKRLNGIIEYFIRNHIFPLQKEIQASNEEF